MLKDLDESIAALLRDSLPADWKEKVRISFAAPDNQFPPQGVSLPAIDLFLYDVRENLDLRSNDVFVHRGSDGRPEQRRAPVRVDCSYLITAWPGEGISDPWEDEHRMLGEVMRALLRHPTIPRRMLQGELASQELPLPASSLQPGRLQSLGEFWQALGGKPKVTLNYTVTVSVDLAVREAAYLVTEKLLDIGPMKRAEAGVDGGAQ
jgi:hypothetical protein